MKPRYSIVRVDNSCPAMLDDFGCIIARNMLHCKCGEDTKNYGDTKEQLIRKVEQGIIIASKKKQIYIANPKAFSKAVSKIIVEFLGVK